MSLVEYCILFLYDYLDEQREKRAGVPGVLNMADIHQFAIQLSNKRIKDIQEQLEIADRPTLTKIFKATKNTNKFDNQAVACQFLNSVLEDIPIYCKRIFRITYINDYD